MSIVPTEEERASAVLICRAAGFSVAMEVGQFSAWLTGGCAAAFSLVLSNPDGVEKAVGGVVLFLLNFLALGIMLGFWVKYRLISHNAAKGAYEEAVAHVGNSGALNVGPFPDGVQVAILQTMPWHLRRRIRKALKMPLDVASRDTLVRAVEITKILCMAQVLVIVACVVATAWGPILLSFGG